MKILFFLSYVGQQIAKGKFIIIGLFLFGFFGYGQSIVEETGVRPNILWLYVEDISPNLSTYGETTIETPNIDRLANQGVKFTKAFVTSPICSPSRSALISGMNQATLGAHNHRSQVIEGKGGGNSSYFRSYELPESIKLLPELFREAGYYTSNKGKTDYNFVWDVDIYSGTDWANRAECQPFFAQIQLKGGKARDAEVKNPVNPAEVNLPPYYPDHPVVRQAWAEYLNAILALDDEVGDILKHLEEEGIAENTVIFFFSDHGMSHARGKQFLYDEGINVPLIIRWPQHLEAGQVNNDLVSHLDIAATSLAVANIPIPENVQGNTLIGSGYQPRTYISSGRDRADETVDVIRAIRTDKYKYIRNYYAHRPHAQDNQYRALYPEFRLMRQLYAEGKLDSVQASLFNPIRPPEELYDLQNDPYEINNLASDSRYGEILKEMRQLHIQEMENIRDMGLIPEPILEDLGKKYGNKYFILQHPENSRLIENIREVIHQGEEGNVDMLLKSLKEGSPSVRYFAATGLGNLKNGDEIIVQTLRRSLTDSTATVRVAAAIALSKLNHDEKVLQTLVSELNNQNLLVRLYAILGLEEIGKKALPARREIEKKTEGEYEYVRRVARRLEERFGNWTHPAD